MSQENELTEEKIRKAVRESLERNWTKEEEAAAAKAVEMAEAEEPAEAVGA